MGLLRHLLFWPVTGPNYLTRFSLEKVMDVAREELTDDRLVKEDLLELQMSLELGEIDDEEYVAREAALMERLRDVRYWREQFGMSTSGGAVRVARESDEEEVTAEEREAKGEGGVASPEGAEVDFDLGWE